jgi:hypothetical protein
MDLREIILIMLCRVVPRIIRVRDYRDIRLTLDSVVRVILLLTPVMVRDILDRRILVVVRYFLPLVRIIHFRMTVQLRLHRFSFRLFSRRLVSSREISMS